MASLGMALKKFDKRVTIYKYLQNDLKRLEAKGLYQKEVETTPDGKIEHRYLYLLFKKGIPPFGWKISRIPAPSSRAYSLIDNAEHINLYQLDQNTFFPVIFKSGVLTALVDTVKMEMGEDGKPTPKLDEKGNQIPETVERAIFDSRVMLKDGRIVDVPLGIAEETYNNVEWLGTEVMKANRDNKKPGGWLDVLKQNAFSIVLLFTCIILVWINWDGMAKLAAQNAQTASQLTQVTNNLGILGKAVAPLGGAP